MTTSSGKFVGIDVAKEKLDIAVLGETKESQIANDEKGIAKLIQEMKRLEPELIVVEATGGYQRAVVLGIYEAGLPVAMVNPSRVRQYARACGLLAKTDKLDAFNLAEFGKQVRPRQFEAKSEAGDGSDLIGRTARVGETGPEEDRRLGGLGAHELGQWQETRLSEDEGRKDRSAQCVVHVDPGGDEVQPVDQGSGSRIIETGEGQEGGVDCLHAKIPDHPERDDARSGPIQADDAGLRWTVFPFQGGFSS